METTRLDLLPGSLRSRSPAGSTTCGGVCRGGGNTACGGSPGIGTTRRPPRCGIGSLRSMTLNRPPTRLCNARRGEWTRREMLVCADKSRMRRLRTTTKIAISIVPCCRWPRATTRSGRASRTGAGGRSAGCVSTPPGTADDQGPGGPSVVAVPGLAVADDPGCDAHDRPISQCGPTISTVAVPMLSNE